MRVLILLIGALCAPALGVERGKSGDGEPRSGCDTYTVVNEAANTKSTITRCKILLDAGLPDAYREVEVEESQDPQNPYDHGDPFDGFSVLDVQKSLAKSTESIKDYTLWGLLVGTGGLLFLGFTLSATRHAATAADRTAKASERAEQPFVHFSVDAQYVGGKKGTREGPFEEIEVRPVLRNYGASPAIDIHYYISVSGQDRRTFEDAARGYFPRGSCEALSSGDELSIDSLVPFPQGFYYEQNERHYIVSCVYGYSDIRGNVLAERETAHYAIWPQMPGETGEIYNIGVRKLTEEEVVQHRERADEYDRLIRERGGDPRE